MADLLHQIAQVEVLTMGSTPRSRLPLTPKVVQKSLKKGVFSHQTELLQTLFQDCVNAWEEDTEQTGEIAREGFIWLLQQAHILPEYMTGEEACDIFEACASIERDTDSSTCPYRCNFSDFGTLLSDLTYSLFAIPSIHNHLPTPEMKMEALLCLFDEEQRFTAPLHAKHAALLEVLPKLLTSSTKEPPPPPPPSDAVTEPQHEPLQTPSRRHTTAGTAPKIVAANASPVKAKKVEAPVPGRDTVRRGEGIQGSPRKSVTYRAKTDYGKMLMESGFQERLALTEKTRKDRMVERRKSEFDQSRELSRAKIVNKETLVILKNSTLHKETKEQMYQRLHTSRAAAEMERNDALEKEVQGLFKPAITKNPRYMKKDRHGTGIVDNWGESLYQSARIMQQRRKDLLKETEEREQEQRNSRKVSQKSASLIREALEKEVNGAFGEKSILRYSEFAEFLRDGFFLKPLSIVSASEHERQAERNLLLRIWPALVPSGAPGLDFRTCLALVVTVMRSSEDKVVEASEDSFEPQTGLQSLQEPGKMAADLRTLYLNRVTYLKSGFRKDKRKAVAEEQTRNQKEEEEKECRFQPKLCKRSIKLANSVQNRDSKQFAVKSRLDLLYHRAKLTEANRSLKRMQAMKQELKQCTFVPNMSKTQKYASGTETVGRKLPIHERLYKIHKDKQEKEKEEKERLEREQAEADLSSKEKKELKEQCTFRPKINRVPKRSAKPSHVPKGFQRSIERLRRGAQDRVDRREEREMLGRVKRPVEAGSTQVKPFQFATSARVEVRQQMVETRRREERRMQKQEEMDALEKREVVRQAAVLARQNSFRKRPLPSSSVAPVVEEEPFMFVDVNISADRTERIALWRGDNVRKVAEQFVTQHRLPKSLVGKLEQMLESQKSIVEARDGADSPMQPPPPSSKAAPPPRLPN